MLLARLLRGQILRSQLLHPCLWRFYSENPQLRSNLFSTQNVPTPQNVPLDTYPNPVYGFSKRDLLSLELDDLKHLLSIPYKTVSETDKFCFNVLEIVHDNIVLNPAVAAKYILAIQDPDTRRTIMDCLKMHYKDDLLRRSLILYIDNPTSLEARHEVLSTLEKIVSNTEISTEERAQMGLSYLRKLALTGQANCTEIYAPENITNVLMLLPQTLWGELFACLLHVNMKFRKQAAFEKLKKTLLVGSNLDRVVARTGLLDVSWKDANKYDFDSNHKERMVNFFSFSDLSLFTRKAIGSKDVVNANIYLDLLVTKFEKLQDQTKYMDRLQVMLRTMLHHLMVFKGPQECIKFLKYMVEANLDIEPRMLLSILSQFRQDSHFEEALMLINYLHDAALTSEQRHTLTSEIMKVITCKFRRQPQVAVGYFAAIFGSGEELLRLLDDLHILEVIYGPQVVLSQIKKADVHQDLQGQKVTQDALRDMYSVMLHRISEPSAIDKLFTAYLSKIVEAKRINNTSSIFHPATVSDDIVCLFFDHLLRVDPDAHDTFDLLHDPARYNTAKDIYTRFCAEVPVKRQGRKVYMYDLLTTSSLLHHRDIAFAVQLMRHSRESGMPLTFNQLYPFIMYHYLRGEFDHAEKWHRLLVMNGVKAKNTSADRLIEIARELKWAVKGSSYRSSVYRKNKQARREMARITGDPLAAFFPGNTEGHSKAPAHDTNLVEDLGAILHASSH